jgi:hypothetical protein
MAVWDGLGRVERYPLGDIDETWTLEIRSGKRGKDDGQRQACGREGQCEPSIEAGSDGKGVGRGV